MGALNPLPRWQRRGLYASLLLLLASGLGWLAVHYTVGAGTGDGLPHWSEPWWMRLHGAAVMASLFFVGTLLPGHAMRGWRMGRQRRLGLVLWTLLALLVVSGYLLYYFAPDDWRPAIGLTHSAIGVLLGLALLWHRRGSRHHRGVEAPRGAHLHPKPVHAHARRHHPGERGA
jgi:hypothetical protein